LGLFHVFLNGGSCAINCRAKYFANSDYRNRSKPKRSSFSFSISQPRQGNPPKHHSLVLGLLWGVPFVVATNLITPVPSNLCGEVNDEDAVQAEV
jgi:hypothetical protein